MRPLRIGIIGAGGIVRHRHLPELRKLPSVEIVAIANSTPASARSFCAEHAPEARACEHWEEIITQPDIDIVWIGTTPRLHKPASLAALAAGKHVFCQARMACDLAEAHDMLAAAEAHPDRVAMLCPPPHGLAGDAFMKKLIGENSVGILRAIRLRSFTDAFLDPTKPPHWRQLREISGLNVLSLGIHTEVLQRWFGDFTVTSAQGKVFTSERAGYSVEIPDILQVLAHFDSGALANLEFSGVHPGEAVDQLEIAGTTGILVYDYGKDKIHLQRHGETRWQALAIPAELRCDWTVECDFIKAVRNPEGPRPHPDFRDGLRYMQVVQTVGNFLASGPPITT